MKTRTLVAVVLWSLVFLAFIVAHIDFNGG